MNAHHVDFSVISGMRIFACKKCGKFVETCKQVSIGIMGDDIIVQGRCPLCGDYLQCIVSSVPWTWCADILDHIWVQKVQNVQSYNLASTVNAELDQVRAKTFKKEATCEELLAIIKVSNHLNHSIPEYMLPRTREVCKKFLVSIGFIEV